MQVNRRFFKPKNKIVCKQQNASWKASLGTRLQNAETCASKEPTRKKGLDGEATECSLHKDCSCMLNTDYTWIRKSYKLTRMQTRNRKSTLCGLIWYSTSGSTQQRFRAYSIQKLLFYQHKPKPALGWLEAIWQLEKGNWPNGTHTN